MNIFISILIIWLLISFISYITKSENKAFLIVITASLVGCIIYSDFVFIGINTSLLIFFSYMFIKEEMEKKK